MQIDRRSFPLIASAVILNVAAAQTTIVATAESVDSVTLRFVNTSTGQSTPVGGAFGAPIRLLDLGLASWFDRNALDDEVPRVVGLGNGIDAISLPDEGSGLIVHYQRANGTIFGFARAGFDGSFTVMIERGGLGAGSDVNPFDPMIGIDPDGAVALISAAPAGLTPTDPAVFLVATDGERFDNGTFAIDILPGTPGPVAGSSLTLANGAVLAVAGSTLLRALDQDGAPLTPFALPSSGGSPPAFIHPELVVSEDESRVLVLAGANETAVDLYEIRLSDWSARVVTSTPAWIVGPGNSEYTSKAPLLAITDDGSAAAFQVRVGSDSELFIADLAVQAAPHHLSKEPYFDPYIDQMSGILTGGSLVAFFASGGYANKADFYATTATSAAGFATKNLTATSGTPLPPFADLAEMKVHTQRALGDSLLIVDNQQEAGAGFRFWVVDELNQAANLVSGLLAPPLLSASNEDANAIVGSFELPGYTILALFPTEPILGTPMPVLALPATISFRALAIDAIGSTLLVAVELTSGFRAVARLELATGAVAVAPQGIFASDVTSLRFGPNGSVLFTTKSSQGAETAHVWDPATGTSAAFGPHSRATWLR